METLKKIKQTEYHLKEMQKYSEEQDEYLFNLASFIGNAREVTFYLQKEYKHHPYFEKWYKIKQDEMNNDRIFKFFHKKRTIVTHKYYPKVAKFTGEVKFYYIGPDLNIRSGSCWSHPTGQPSTILVPGGSITISQEGATANSNETAILQKHEYESHYFFDDFLNKPIGELCEEHLNKIKQLYIEWEKVNQCK